jgi:hypothetical protein
MGAKYIYPSWTNGSKEDITKFNVMQYVATIQDESEQIP